MERRSLKNKLFILSLGLFFLVSTILYFIPSVRSNENWAEDLAQANLFYKVETEDFSGLTVDFVDVGQGDCAIISCNDKYMLIDCGEGEYYQVVRNFLEKRNITHLDFVLLSHPHSDHGGGMEKIIENYSIDTFLLPDVNEDIMEEDDFFTGIMLTLEEKEVHSKTVTSGEIYRLSDAEIKILGPLDIGEDGNEMSVVCMLEYGDKKFLFTGDAPVSEELELIENDVSLECDVLKVSHHGSKDATSDEFLAEATPDYAVIPVGEYNEYRHPHSKTIQKLLKRDVEIYRTDKDGTVTFRIPDINSEITVR